METARSRELDPNYLLGLLNTARREINNLRQQIKNLRYIFDKDITGVKHMIEEHSRERKSTPAPDADRSPEPASTSTPSSALSLEPIGVINTGFPSKRGVPRQPGICRESRGRITLFNSVFTNPEHSLNGLQDFSHMWILFHFHRNESTHVHAKVAPPRLNGAKTGVFSTRSPHRPCPIGLSLVKILKIEGNTILFEGVDTVDGTPVLDIKPYIPQYDNPLHVEKLIQSTPERINWPATGENSTFELEECSTDVSHDEELALRLQTEEFQHSSAIDLDFIEPQSEHEVRAEASGPAENHLPVLESLEDARSRLLDGADGSSTILGTDVDLINRRALSSRLDNSPIRMGVREAPDGEEGLESQTLRSSQTVGNMQSIAVDSGDAEGAQFRVRVPDWITQPRTRSLSVIFNDRALRQLNEIVNDKADEQKRAIVNVLREDPRSVYLRQRWANQFYTFLIHDLHISCRFDDSRGIVTVFQIRHAGRTCECGEPEWQCLGHSPAS